MPRSCPTRAPVLSCLLARFVSTSADAAPDRAGAARVFETAYTLCQQDGGALWDKSLCGPMLILDPADRAAIANQQDAGGVLSEQDGVFVGTLPQSANLANTHVTWSGTDWTQLLWPVPLAPNLLRVLPTE